MLALMETLADFGTVAMFNYNTFTTAIYKTWFSLFSLPAASQLASLLTLFVFLVVLLETQSRAKRSHAASAKLATRSSRIPLRGGMALLATGWSALVFLLAFAIPVGQMLGWSGKVFAQDFDARYLDFAWHSLALAGIGAGLVVILALLLAYAQRLDASPLLRIVVRLASIGYALPGAVLAVGIFIPVAWLDNLLIDTFHLDGQVLSGTLVVMLLAYCARFLAVGFGPLESGLARVSRAMDEAAQSLGVLGAQRLWRVHLPLLRVPLLTAAALAFVDIMKELPITLMTRPFGWDTLAVRVFEMTSEGEWERAALPATAIALVGLLPVFLLTRSTDQHARA
jgi:iron(III) transport system permease protein